MWHSPRGFFLCLVNETIGERENEILTRDVIEFEMLTAMREMANSKSPGLNGLPSEFYKTQWQILGGNSYK